MVERAASPCIYTLAGPNGAGKSSVAAAILLPAGIDFFNPDEVTVEYRAADPAATLAEANIAAWEQGRALLERALAEKRNYAFETTLGGKTITALLASAPAAGVAVRLWYVGLNSVELHLARVRARVAAGGHDIPEGKIRERFDGARLNLIRLMPILAELRVYDNSAEADPESGRAPEPKLLLHMERGKRVAMVPLDAAPEWVQPILAAAR